jgi:hypothetical protein
MKLCSCSSLLFKENSKEDPSTPEAENFSFIHAFYKLLPSFQSVKLEKEDYC